jgi:hypothetical protein
VYALNGAPSIYVGGTLKTVTTDYTIDSRGMVTFASAPAGAAALTWTGAFYWEVRFENDTTDFKNFANSLWAVNSLPFASVK